MNLSSFYWSKQWRKTSQLYMQNQHGICERCGGLAHIIHHREYLSPANVNNLDIALGWDNLEALCFECHNKEHKGGAVTAQGLIFNELGDIVPQ